MSDCSIGGGGSSGGGLGGLPTTSMPGGASGLPSGIPTGGSPSSGGGSSGGGFDWGSLLGGLGTLLQGGSAVAGAADQNKVNTANLAAQIARQQQITQYVNQYLQPAQNPYAQQMASFVGGARYNGMPGQGGTGGQMQSSPFMGQRTDRTPQPIPQPFGTGPTGLSPIEQQLAGQMPSGVQQSPQGFGSSPLIPNQQPQQAGAGVYNPYVTQDATATNPFAGYVDPNGGGGFGMAASPDAATAMMMLGQISGIDPSTFGLGPNATPQEIDQITRMLGGLTSGAPGAVQAALSSNNPTIQGAGFRYGAGLGSGSGPVTAAEVSELFRADGTGQPVYSPQQMQIALQYAQKNPGLGLDPNALMRQGNRGSLENSVRSMGYGIAGNGQVYNPAGGFNADGSLPNQILGDLNDPNFNYGSLGGGIELGDARPFNPAAPDASGGQRWTGQPVYSMAGIAPTFAPPTPPGGVGGVQTVSPGTSVPGPIPNTLQPGTPVNGASGPGTGGLYDGPPAQPGNSSLPGMGQAYSYQAQNPFTYNPGLVGGPTGTQGFNTGQDPLMQMQRTNLDPGSSGSGLQQFDNSDIFSALKKQNLMNLDEQVNALHGSAGSLGARFGTAMNRNEGMLRERALTDLGSQYAQIGMQGFESAQGRQLQALLGNQNAFNQAGQFNAAAGQTMSSQNAQQGNIYNQLVMQGLQGAAGVQQGQQGANTSLIALLAGLGVPQASPSAWPGAAGQIGQLATLYPFLQQLMKGG